MVAFLEAEATSERVACRRKPKVAPRRQYKSNLYSTALRATLDPAFGTITKNEVAVRVIQLNLHITERGEWVCCCLITVESKQSRDCEYVNEQKVWDVQCISDSLQIVERELSHLVVVIEHEKKIRTDVIFLCMRLSNMYKKQEVQPKTSTSMIVLMRSSTLGN